MIRSSPSEKNDQDKLAHVQMLLNPNLLGTVLETEVDDFADKIDDS